MKKTIYSVEWNGIFEIHIEIEHSEKTNKLLHLIGIFKRFRAFKKISVRVDKI